MSDVARQIAERLVQLGFSQTDIARGLGMQARGSGSYVGQVLQGKKGGQQLAALRQLVAAAEAAPSVPAGRSRAATARRQAILTAKPVPKPQRTTATGAAPRVRRKNWQVIQTRTGRLAMDAFAGEAELRGAGGGKGPALMIDALAQHGGRFAFRVVARFAPEKIPTDGYWKRFARPGKGPRAKRYGPKTVQEARFGYSAQGFSATEWRDAIAEHGTLRDAMLDYLAERGYEPNALLRVEIDGWLP
jgi:hypothetical protein